MDPISNKKAVLFNLTNQNPCSSSFFYSERWQYSYNNPYLTKYIPIQGWICTYIKIPVKFSKIGSFLTIEVKGGYTIK